jgi:protein-S-isoprenylcysteine O-methyltransferase Ste14
MTRTSPQAAPRPEIRGAVAAETPSGDRPGVVAPAPLLYGGAFLIGSLLHYLFPMPILPLHIAPWTGLALLSVGAALAVWSRRTMEKAKTNVNPLRPATALVVTGPFRFSRNPMYLARTVLYVGLGFLTNAFCVIALLCPLLIVMQVGVILPEERYMEAKFGDAYRQYRATARRWI